MSIPKPLKQGLRLPAIVSPMFLTSGPDLVVESCRSGLIGTFPALNQRTTAGFAAWMDEIEERLASVPDHAAYGVNLIVHRSNPRLSADLEMVVRHKVPLIITSLGAVPDVVEAVHSYGGLVFHDIINRRHAEKAAEAGVDGIIAVAAGAGGHAGSINPLALVAEIASFYSGTIVLSGSISTGAQIAAARMLGADLAYLGTRFIATAEALVEQGYKQMIVGSRASDILYTPNVSGVNANFMRQSIVQAGLDPDDLPAYHELDMRKEAKAWKQIWSAGHGVGAINDVLGTADLCSRLITEYGEAIDRARSDDFGIQQGESNVRQGFRSRHHSL